MRTSLTVTRARFDGKKAVGLGGFVLATAFWLAMVNAIHLLEDSRSAWWIAGLIGLALSLPALAFALSARKGWMLAVWGFASVAVVALAALPWHPRKAFLDDLESLTPGTPLAAVQARMARYVENAEVAVEPRLDVPVPTAVPPDEGSISYRWNTTDPRYNADIGVVEYANDRVTRTMFLPD